jgi:hypothetical protein
MMDRLVSFASRILVAARMERDLSVVSCVLYKLRQLFEVELHEDVMKLVQELIPTELLDAVYSVTTVKYVRGTLTMGKVELFHTVSFIFLE